VEAPRAAGCPAMGRSDGGPEKGQGAQNGVSEEGVTVPGNDLRKMWMDSVLRCTRMAARGAGLGRRRLEEGEWARERET
jgi:hypothetical protein